VEEAERHGRKRRRTRPAWPTRRSSKWTLHDLSDQLLVGTGFCARGSVVCRNSQRYARGPLRWWTPLSKYDQPVIACA
jgi:hypothetical protein